MKIDKIDYESIRERLVSFLKGDPRFRDYNFEASGLATLINLLAYNSHYLGAYMAMLNNESSIDTAQLKQSVYSKSRGLGYTPRLTKSAVVEVTVTCDLDTFPTLGYVVLHRGKKISGTSQRLSATRYFTNMDDVYLYDYEQTANGWKFKSQPTTLVEGELQSWEFVVDQNILYQPFVIKDTTVDIDSLRVYVKNSDSDEGTRFHPAANAMTVGKQDAVYYTSVTHDGFVEIYFGGDLFGKKPTDGQIIRCEYMSSTGEEGNGCNVFSFPGFGFETEETSNSGSAGESIESTRFNAINHFRSQGRLITPDDYRSAILRYFRNLQAVNVWRGEEHWQKTYGKIFISIKPHYADRLSASAKKEVVAKLLDQSKKLGADPVFVDPEFIECYVDLVLKTTLDKSSVSIQSVQNSAIAAARQYDTDVLNVFGNSLSDVELNDRVRKSSQYIDSCYTRKTLRKTASIRMADNASNAVFFGNDIVPGSLKTSTAAGIYEYTITDDSNGNIIATSTNNTRHVTKTIGKVNYETGLVEMFYPVERQTGTTQMTFEVTPANADIDSSFNNIIRIARVRVVDE